MQIFHSQHMPNNFILMAFCDVTEGSGASFRKDGNGRTNGRTDGRTDGQTDVEVEIVI